MRTIGVIDPSSTARASLAAGLRAEFAVVEGGVLTPALAEGGASLIVAAAEAVSRHQLAEPPFAALPFLIVGRFPDGDVARDAPVRVVERPLDARELLPHARALLGAQRGAADVGHDAMDEASFLPEGLQEVLARAARAHRARLPVLITGERGTGKRSAAQTLHRRAGYGPLVRLTPPMATAILEGRVPGALVASGMPVTIVADGIDVFPGEIGTALADCLAAGDLGPLGIARPFWLLATTCADLEALARAGRFDAALAARLAEVVIAIPPLRDRAGAIGRIAGEILARLGGTLVAAPTLTPAALAALEAHGWPGNLAELAAVLRRSALMAPHEEIDAADLLFAGTIGVAPEFPRSSVPGVEARRPPALSEPSIAETAAAAPADPRLEWVLTELAHELKNPMVTIKTFAQHLPSLLEDAELRERFASLTDEAIARMDGLLENVLEFARFGPPRRAAVALPELLDRAIAAVANDIAERSVRIRREGWAAVPVVSADATQLGYALLNMLTSLVDAVPAQHELLVSLATMGTVVFRFAGAEGMTAQLQRFLQDGDGLSPPTAFPLRFVLARAVVARNGGEVAVEAGLENETLVTVRLDAGGV
jgi:DNA-binding NtrC family response regulator